MKRAFTFLAWASTLGVVAIMAFNWSQLLAPSAVNLLVTEVQLPLGLAMLAIGALPSALFFVAYLQQQVRALFETRKLLRQLQRANELADKAELSRIEGLGSALTQHFQVLHDRLDAMGAPGPCFAAAPGVPAESAILAPGPVKGGLGVLKRRLQGQARSMAP